MESQAEAGELAWTHWFFQENIEPLRINYEELAAEPRVVLGVILSFLGLDRLIAEFVKVTTAKLADDESLEWIERFYVEVQLKIDNRV